MKKFLNWLLFIFTFGGPIAEEAIKESIFYKYDVSGRLINEKCYEGNNFKYDY